MRLVIEVTFYDHEMHNVNLATISGENDGRGVKQCFPTGSYLEYILTSDIEVQAGKNG